MQGIEMGGQGTHYHWAPWRNPRVVGMSTADTGQVKNTTLPRWHLSKYLKHASKQPSMGLTQVWQEPVW